MAQDEEIEKRTEQVMELADELFNDTRMFSQQESHDMWYALSSEAGNRANLIRDEMDSGGDSEDFEDDDDAMDEEQ